jgi:hypothetical protein
VPDGWIPVNNSQDYVSVKNENSDNYIALSCPSGKTAFLVHKDLTLEAGKKYIINYKVKSGTESAFMVYLEWVDKSKELKDSKRLKSISLFPAGIKAGKDWESKTFAFTCLDEKYSSPYLVLYLKGPGEICFDNIEIQESSGNVAAAAQSADISGNKLIVEQHRKLWQKSIEGENLALGKAVRFSVDPDYLGTVNDKVKLKLTDGLLADRPDGKVWLAPEAIGFTKGEETGVSIMVDLGTVQPIDRAVIRLAGGAEFIRNTFPREIRLLASEDGENFFVIKTIKTIKYRTKDHVPEKGIEKLNQNFYELTPWNRLIADPAVLKSAEIPALGNRGAVEIIPLNEEGQAYVYPFIFKDLRINARFIAFWIRPDGYVNLADEIAVIKRAETVEPVALSEFRRGRLFMDGPAFYFEQEALYVSTNFQMPASFLISYARKKEHRSNPLSYVFELPQGLDLVETKSMTTSCQIQKETFTEGDKPYQRWTLTNLIVIPRNHEYKGSIGPFYFKITDQNLLPKDPVAYCYPLDKDYVPNRFPLPVKFISMPVVPSLENLSISIGWMSSPYMLEWPDFFNAYKAAGFNAMPSFPYSIPNYSDSRWGQYDTNDVCRQISAAKQSGINIILVDSPFENMQRNHKKDTEIFSQLAGGPSVNCCPSYRGRFYWEALINMGNDFELTRADFQFIDSEMWGKGAMEADACLVCRNKMKELGKTGEDFLAALGTEMLHDINNELKKRSEKLKIPMPALGIYDVFSTGLIYHRVYDFKQLYPELIQFGMPSLYIGGDPQKAHDAMVEQYRATGKTSVIPWITTGCGGKFDARLIEPMILETLMNGAAGFTYFAFSNFNSPLEFYYHAKALAEIAPYQNILKDGKPFELKTDNKLITISGYKLGNELLVLAGNYTSPCKEKAMIALPPGKVLSAVDLRNQTPVVAAKHIDVELSFLDFSFIYLKYEK